MRPTDGAKGGRRAMGTFKSVSSTMFKSQISGLFLNLDFQLQYIQISVYFSRMNGASDALSSTFYNLELYMYFLYLPSR